MLSKNQRQCRIKIKQDCLVQIHCTRFVNGHKSEMFQKPQVRLCWMASLWDGSRLSVVCKSMENERP